MPHRRTTSLMSSGTAVHDRDHVDPDEHARDCTCDEALRDASTDTLLTTFAALTHRLHAAEGQEADSSVERFLQVREQVVSLRAQRDQVRAEILRRTGDA